MAKITNVLIKQARIVDLSSVYNGQVKDIKIENGIITQIEDNLPSDGIEVFKAEQLHVSQGWIDLSANLCEPGFEHKEDLQSGMEAAAHGGFTEVLTQSTTQPVADNKSTIRFIKNSSKTSPVNLHPIGTLTEGALGKNLAELYDMHLNGAVAFSDGKTQVDTAVMTKALLYAKQFSAVLVTHPNNNSLSKHGQVNESINSSLTGLKGLPAIAESMQVQRDLNLLEYTGGKLHFSCISAAKSVEYINEAKRKGLNVTCDIAAHQIAFNDSVVNTFDTNYKVFPPFRTSDDVAALLQGLVDGTIDAVCSDHSPEDVENKNLEFDLAAFGIIGLQTAFAVLNTQLKKHLPIALIVEKFTDRPRQLLGLEKHSIAVGAKANLSCFNPEEKWIFKAEDIKSKSKNTPFVGEELIGKPLAIYNNGVFKAL